MGGLADAQVPPHHHRPFPRPVPTVVAPRPVPARVRLEIEDAGSRSLPTFSHAGRRYVLGDLGQRYRIRVSNPTSARVEAVVSVDGLDALDGQTASFAKRGYIVPAFGDVTIDGFRTSFDTVAAFRFSSVPDSFAGRLGQDRNVGVIGVAVFRERAELEPVEIDRRWGPRPNAAGASRPAPSPPTKSGRRAAEDRGGLGTEFGEERESRIRETTFLRESSQPASVAEVRYDDREGLEALGIQIEPRDRDRDLDLRETAEPFPGWPSERRFATPPP